jgi:TPR repeat protein
MFSCTILAALSACAALAQDPNTIFLPSSVAADTVKANQMNASAHFRLGYKYLSGLAGAMDTKQAAQHFAAAAAQNVPAGSAWLGYSYVVAPELGHSAAEGLALIQQAANAGDSVGMTLLGRLYQTGTGLAEDLNSAKALYLAAGQKFALAWSYLGEMYLASGNPSDATQALLLFQRAAALGETRSMVHLADMLVLGTGVEKDPSHSVEWLNRAAAQNDPVAVYQQGKMYYYGWDRHKSSRMAAYLFMKSANAGYPPAEAALGMCYALGVGITKDLHQAIQWLKLAAPRDSYAANELALVTAQLGGH